MVEDHTEHFSDYIAGSAGISLKETGDRCLNVRVRALTSSRSPIVS